MAFKIKRRGKVTYYYEGDRPVLSANGSDCEPRIAGACSSFFANQLPDNGLPARFTVHVVDVPDQAASYEFYSTALLQSGSRE